MSSSFVKLPALLAASLLLCSCAATSLVDSWSNPDFPGRRYHKVLVVGISKNDNTRLTFEDIFTAELKKRGVEAVAGHTLIPKSEPVDKEVLEDTVHESGAEAMLTMQTIRVEQQTNYQPGYVSSYPGYWYPPAFPAWDFYGYYGAMTYYQPPTPYTYEIATIQANLFDAESGKLVWAATLQSSEPSNVLAVSMVLSKIVIEELIKKGLI